MSSNKMSSTKKSTNKKLTTNKKTTTPKKLHTNKSKNSRTKMLHLYAAFMPAMTTTDIAPHPRHALLILGYTGSETGSVYTIRSSQEMDKPIRYMHHVSHTTSIPNDAFELCEMFATLPAESWSRINDLILSVKPQRCQNFVATVLERLEDEGYVEKGAIAERVRGMIEPSLWEMVQEEPSPAETSIFDLCMLAIELSMGDLKGEKCCY